MRITVDSGGATLVACAALEEAGATYDFVQSHARQEGRRRPWADVVLTDGDVHLQAPAAIILWIGDRFPATGLLPPPGSADRARTFVWLTYLANTLQTAIDRSQIAPAAHVDAALATALRTGATADVARIFDFIDRELRGHTHLVADRFTGADLLLYAIVVDGAVDVGTRPDLTAHIARTAARTSVVQAHHSLLGVIST